MERYTKMKLTKENMEKLSYYPQTNYNGSVIIDKSNKDHLQLILSARYSAGVYYDDYQRLATNYEKVGFVTFDGNFDFKNSKVKINDGDFNTNSKLYDSLPDLIEDNGLENQELIENEDVDIADYLLEDLDNRYFLTEIDLKNEWD